MGTPVFGVRGVSYPGKGTWQASVGWRHQYSDKHFIGTEYQVGRTNEGSQVINDVNIADLGVRYQASKRIELSAGLPYFMGTRSQPLRNTALVNLDRFKTQTHAAGDMVFSARRWMLDPDAHTGGNIQLGLGVKLPTGTNNQVDTFKVFVPATNTITTAVRTVDQSIQPGDGGYGMLAELNAFKTIGDHLGVYASAAYLSNPGGKSSVLTYRTSPGEEVMSIADQYLWRAGASVAVPRVKNLSLSFGGRWEGVPVRDLIGPSDGFRRPGYAISLEPALTYAAGKQIFTLGVPFAVRRNRLVSVADEARHAHGDAAFADHVILVGISRRF